MNQSNRLVLTLVIVVGSTAMALISAIRLISPGTLDGVGAIGPGLLGRVVPDAVDAALGLAAALAGIALGLLGHPASGAAARPRTSLRIASGVVVGAMVLLTPGGLIPFAGYSFAAVVIGGVVALAVLLARRHPWRGVAAFAVLAAIATWVIVELRAGEVASGVGVRFVEQLPGVLCAGAYLVAAVGLVVRMARGGSIHRCAFATWVLRRRTAITVVAACCALPYSIARASWLTPWPLLAPNDLDLSQEPATLFVGLSLGSAMLAGGLLTLGLVRPWGRRFPRWMAGLGGHPVPMALVVVPASAVAALFTVGGVDLLLSTIDSPLSGGSIKQLIEVVVAFPFWLWGPLLALATWGYAMARQDAGSAAAHASVAAEFRVR